MREEYKRELKVIGPDAAELARLADRLKAGNRRRSGVLRPALIAAVLVAVLLGSVGAAAWRAGWLDPVVSYGDNGALIEEYTVKVNETREGNQCDVTLESVVTDGIVLYCSFYAEYDEEFDLDDALEWGGLSIYPNSHLGQTSPCWRVDDGSQPEQARFVCMIGMSNKRYTPRALHGGVYNDSLLGWDFDLSQSMFGKELCLCLRFHKWVGPNEEHITIAENYYFDVQLNSDITLKQVKWDDNTCLTVSPLSVQVAFNDTTPGYQMHYDDDDFEVYCEDWTKYLEELDISLEFEDGTHLDDDSPLLVYHNQGHSHTEQWTCNALACREGNTYIPPSGVVMSRLVPQLIDPNTVTALIINGTRYEID